MNYQCIGQLPQNAKWASDDEQKGLATNTKISYVTQNSSNKCEYTCNTGFTFKNGACVKVIQPEQPKKC